MNFWHMQLHPNDKSWTQKDILDLVEGQGVIGIGESWDGDHGRPWTFQNKFRKGDIVLVRHNGPLCLVQVVGDCFENPDQTEVDAWFYYCRDVKILDKDGNTVKEKYKKETNKNWSDGIFAPVTMDNANNWDFIKFWYSEYLKKEREREMKNIINLIEQKNNIVLQGAPGTGKTYSTTSIAVGLVDQSFNNLDDRSKVTSRYNQLLIKVNPEQKQGDNSKGTIASGQIGFITFHQSMEYEDFIEGIKPVSNGTNVTYTIENGIFKMMARKAANDKAHKYVLIIDEINRGNISKILGELITLLEPDKRDDKENRITVTLPYSKESFSVPSNLYIIGTMNTTDRSVGSVDYAIRRRFAFVTLKSDPNIVETKSSKKALDLFNAVQTFINNNRESELDIADLQIGHSYFLVNKNDKGEELEQRWKYEILPLLREYYKDGIILKDIPEDCRTIETFENFVNE